MTEPGTAAVAGHVALSADGLDGTFTPTAAAGGAATTYTASVTATDVGRQRDGRTGDLVVHDRRAARGDLPVHDLG